VASLVIFLAEAKGEADASFGGMMCMLNLNHFDLSLQPRVQQAQSRRRRKSPR
jgi:hypothetical protein